MEDVQAAVDLVLLGSVCGCARRGWSATRFDSTRQEHRGSERPKSAPAVSSLQIAAK